MCRVCGCPSAHRVSALASSFKQLCQVRISETWDHGCLFIPQRALFRVMDPQVPRKCLWLDGIKSRFIRCCWKEDVKTQFPSTCGGEMLQILIDKQWNKFSPNMGFINYTSGGFKNSCQRTFRF